MPSFLDKILKKDNVDKGVRPISSGQDTPLTAEGTPFSEPKNTLSKSGNKNKMLLGGAAAVVLLAAGGYFIFMDDLTVAPPVASSVQQAKSIAVKAPVMPPQPTMSESTEVMVSETEIPALTIDVPNLEAALDITLDTTSTPSEMAKVIETAVEKQGVIEDTEFNPVASSNPEMVPDMEVDEYLNEDELVFARESEMPEEKGLMTADQAMEKSMQEELKEEVKVETASSYSDAEEALLKNTSILGELPVAKSEQTEEEFMADDFSHPAPIRPLPSKYFQLKKTHEASDLNTRVVAARRVLNKNQISSAYRMFDELYQDYPSDTRVIMGRAVTLQKMGNASAALEMYEETLKQDPRNLGALANMLGILRQEEPDMALDKLEALHKKYPSHAGIAAQLGTTLGSEKRYAEAVQYLKIASGLEPKNASYIYNRAVIFDHMGDRIKAASMYIEALKLDHIGGGYSGIPVADIHKRLVVIE